MHGGWLGRLSVGGLGGRLLSLLGSDAISVGVALKWRVGLSRAALRRLGDQVSWTTLCEGVRQDNWSEGRFRCRWPEAMWLHGSAVSYTALLCLRRRLGKMGRVRGVRLRAEH